MLTLIAAIAIYHHVVLRSEFLALRFAFHDLGLISDWFSNAIYEGRPFWISDMELNHFAVHFTPSLFLLIPLYALASSQYFLLGLSIFAVAVGLWLQYRLWSVVASERRVARLAAALIGTVLTLLLGLNIFLRTVIQSTHYEIVFLPLGLAFVLALVRNRPVLLQALWFGLALGVRTEAGLYLSTLALACLALPWSPERDRAWRRRVWIFAALATTYVVLVTTVVWPVFFGVHENHVNRGWAQWGASWPQVWLHIVSSPRVVAEYLARSAFLHLNGSFLFLAGFAPLAGALVNAPALLLYTASTPDRVGLWHYNAAFLLPGLSLASMMGAARIARWCATASSRPALRWLTPLVFVGLALGLQRTVWKERYATAEVPRGYMVAATEVGSARRSVLLETAALCGWYPALATDFWNLSLLPFRSKRFLLRHYGRADAVVLFTGADPFLSSFRSMTEARDAIAADPRYGLVVETADHSLFFRLGGPCRIP